MLETIALCKVLLRRKTFAFSENITLDVLEEIWLAKEAAIKLCQEEFKKNLKKTRQQYYRLDVRIDDRGVVPSGGRLDKSSLSDDVKRPIIVPGQHLLVRLMAEHYHQKFRDQGYRVVIANLRQEGILIAGGKKLLKSVAACCMFCRLRRRKLLQQRMGALPSFRVQPSLHRLLQ